MKIFIISDTHFNHTKPMVDWCGRPENFEELLWKGLEKLPEDCLLIHLGDICIGNDLEVHNAIADLPYRKVLVKGNHDSKSNSWYFEHGWDFVCDRFDFEMFGKKIAFTHIPIAWDGYHDFNIHGHFHNSDHRRQEPELQKIKNGYQKLYAPEYENYLPVKLSKFLTS